MTFGAVQDVSTDRQAVIKSIATVFGVCTTVFIAATMYLAASLVVASIGNIYGTIVAGVGLVYLLNVLVYFNITDITSQQTGAGWKRFLLLNYLAGTVTIFCLIASAVL